MGLSRQEYWSGWPLPPPGDLPNQGMEPGSAAAQADSIPAEPPGKLKPLLTLSIHMPSAKGEKQNFSFKNLFLPPCVIFTFYVLLHLTPYTAFPGGSAVRKPPANAGGVDFILG